MANWLEEFGGGFRDDYDLTIVQAFFAPDASYQDGSTFLLNLIGLDENGEPANEKFNAAKTSEWASYDMGKTLIPTGKVKQLNKSTMYGHLVQFAVACGAGDVLASRGTSTNAECWVGLKFHFKQTEISFGKGIDPTTRNMPVAFLGVVDLYQPAPASVQQSFPAPAPVAAPVAAPPAPAPVAPVVQMPTLQAPTPAANGTSPVVAQLDALAKSSPDFNTFIKSALLIDGVMTDDSLLSTVTDANGFFADHHV